MAISNINFKANVQENGTELKKQKGRLVIGISGAHTLDDADILFGANESDAVDNSAKLEAAIQKGGFNEIVFLEGKYHVQNMISFQGTIRGRRNGVAGFHGTVEDYNSSYSTATAIVSTNDWGEGIFNADRTTIRDLTITCTDTAYNSVENGSHVGVYCDFGENVIVENVTFEKITGSAIHIYEGYDVKISNCVVRNCGIDSAVYASDVKYGKIENCDIEGNVHLDSYEQNKLYVISNRIIGDGSFINCCMVNNQIEGAVTNTNCFTTIGTTKLTEDKVKALNEVGTQYTFNFSSDINSVDISHIPFGWYAIFVEEPGADTGSAGVIYYPDDSTTSVSYDHVNNSHITLSSGQLHYTTSVPFKITFFRIL